MRIRRHVIALAALALAAACTRAPVSDGISSRAENPHVAPPARAAADAGATAAPSRLLPPSEALDDGVISARIRAALLVDPAMGSSDVSVNTDHGVVTLTGVVASREQAAIASAHAQSQDGVMRVDDHLAVDLR